MAYLLRELRNAGCVKASEVLDKPFTAPASTELLGYFWSGRHHKVVKGISLTTLFYTDTSGLGLPVNLRIYRHQEGKSKHAYFQEADKIVAIHLGNRCATGARGLWEQLPEHYRQLATFFTDDWKAFKQVVPAERHRASGRKKDTNNAQWLFCTLRQRRSLFLKSSTGT
uniref:hypothetical protein n=1 Tax=Pontibacter russatus TaxID=2694929 RepID=UPI001379F333|nr:hypothetical protein [Pontibacter russatus]